MSEVPFKVEGIVPLEVRCSPALLEMYRLSPFVWREGARYSLMLRAVPHAENPADKIARIYYGQSDDGLSFRMDVEPAIAPGTDGDDPDGCEDPTVVVEGGRYFVYYTGWNETKKRGQLLLAEGADVRKLCKVGVQFPSTKRYRNPKEATVVPRAGGGWCMFFEFARAGASKIGVAMADELRGPWTPMEQPFESRRDAWDDWHLSPGPILWTPPEPPVMFYNGGSREAHWRIGWIVFDSDYSRIIARCDEPLIFPPRLEGDATDIAFAASCVARSDHILLYYSIADKVMLRATIRRFETGKFSAKAGVPV
jgi:predicted GH43/DUF377 family glycosyl hydrolase